MAILLFLPIHTILKKISFPDYKKVQPSLRTRGKTGEMAGKSSAFAEKGEFVAVFAERSRR